MKRGWTGLLIEPNPDYFKHILHIKRNAHLINSCLSTEKRAQSVKFKKLGLVGGVEAYMDESHLKLVKRLSHYNESDITVQCFTLSSILKALNVNHIDYFSLDVGGSELKILQTIPLDKITIDVISIDYRQWDGVHIDATSSAVKLKQLREFFSDLGNYKEVGILPWGKDNNPHKNESLGLDVIFERIH